MYHISRFIYTDIDYIFISFIQRDTKTFHLLHFASYSAYYYLYSSV